MKRIQGPSFVFSSILTCLLMLQACGSPPLPEEMVGEPVFYLEGTRAEEPFTYEAGNDGRYMHSDHERADPGITVFYGGFAPASCRECPESLEIWIRDQTLSELSTSVDAFAALSPGSYPYFQDAGADGDFVYRVSFSNQPSGSGNTSYEWDFGDGTMVSGLNPTHDYADTSLTEARVCLEAVDANGCVTEICNEVNLTEAGCKADFTHQLTPNTTFVRFVSESSGERPLSYRWNFGDGYGATLGNPGYTYADTGLYTVCLTVTDGAGCQSVICKNIAADPVLCENNFTYAVEKTNIPDLIQASAVTVRWRDEQGELYSSDLGEQDELQSFEILDIESYEPNRAGQATVRLKVRFDCVLYGENDELQLSGVTGYVAMAYPD